MCLLPLAVSLVGENSPVVGLELQGLVEEGDSFRVLFAGEAELSHFIVGESDLILDFELERLISERVEG